MTQYLGKTVMKQFSNSPIMLALLNDFDQWCDLTQFSAAFLSNVWDITQAQGFGLDIWGRILGQSRYLQITPAPNKNFGFNIAPTDVQNALLGFGVGDGTTTTFTIKGNAGQPVTPITGAIYYVNGVATTPASQTGMTVTFSPAPPVASTLRWTGGYNQTGTAWKPWSQAPFYGGQSAGTVAFPLQDTYFRKLLLVKAAANIARSDCPSINALMRAMFGDRGRCYIGYDINAPMHIAYHFDFFPTPVEKSIIQSGLFPQPAGTLASYVYQTLTYIPFGFAGSNLGANPKVVTGWNQGEFYMPSNSH